MGSSEAASSKIAACFEIEFAGQRWQRGLFRLRHGTAAISISANYCFFFAAERARTSGAFARGSAMKSNSGMAS